MRWCVPFMLITGVVQPNTCFVFILAFFILCCRWIEGFNVLLNSQNIFSRRSDWLIRYLWVIVKLRRWTHERGIIFFFDWFILPFVNNIFYFSCIRHNEHTFRLLQFIPFPVVITENSQSFIQLYCVVLS